MLIVRHELNTRQALEWRLGAQYFGIARLREPAMGAYKTIIHAVHSRR